MRLLLLLLSLSYVVVVTAYTCGTASTPCIAPGCLCPSFTAPGGLPPAQTPQFVLLSIDDWVVGDGTRNVVYNSVNTKDARGCSPRLTAYTSTMWTDYRFAEQLYKDGHEIALHTVSHTTDFTSSQQKWDNEIRSGKGYMQSLSEVPGTSIRGFRAPYLSYSTAMFTVMGQQNLTFDSSMYCDPTTSQCPYGNFFWPFTLDYGSPFPCGSSSGTANGCIDPVPGMWEVPMTMLYDNRSLPHATDGSLFMDPVPPSDYSGGLLQLLIDNFDAHYNGSRAPFSIHYHATYVQDATYGAARVQALLDFFTYASRRANVFFVTGLQLLTWMKNPVPAAVLAASQNSILGSCAVQNPSSCNANNADNLCFYNEQTFKTCATCPEYWPDVCLDNNCMDNEECTCPSDCPGKTCYTGPASWIGKVTVSSSSNCASFTVNNTNTASMARNWKVAVSANPNIQLSAWGLVSLQQVSSTQGLYVFTPKPDIQRIKPNSVVPTGDVTIGFCWQWGMDLTTAFPNPFVVTVYQHDCVNTPCPGMCMDGVCDPNETCQSCSWDCTHCCGDGHCLSGETCSSCPQDCGTCSCSNGLTMGAACNDGVHGANSGRCVSGGTCQYLCDYPPTACPTRECQTTTCTVTNALLGTVSCTYTNQTGTACSIGTCISGTCVSASTQPITSLSVVAVDSNADVDMLVNEDAVNLAAYPAGINIRANRVLTGLSQVKTYVDDVLVSISTTSPYTFGGYSNGNYLAWVPPLGRHNLSAIACTSSLCFPAYSLFVTFVSAPVQTCSDCGAVLGSTCLTPACEGAWFGLASCYCNTTLAAECQPSCSSLSAPVCQQYICAKGSSSAQCVLVPAPGRSCGSSATGVCDSSGQCVDVCSPNPCTAAGPCGTSTCSLYLGGALCTAGYLAAGSTGGCDPSSQFCDGTSANCRSQAEFCAIASNAYAQCGPTSSCIGGVCVDVCSPNPCLTSNLGCQTVQCQLSDTRTTYACSVSILPSGSTGSCTAGLQYCDGVSGQCQTYTTTTTTAAPTTTTTASTTTPSTTPTTTTAKPTTTTLAATATTTTTPKPTTTTTASTTAAPLTTATTTATPKPTTTTTAPAPATTAAPCNSPGNSRKCK